MPKLENIKQILVINLGGIGDLILSTPALRALKEAYPEAKVTLLVVARAYKAVQGLPYVDEVTVFHKEPLRILEDIGLLVYLRKRHFDLAVNMRTLVSRLGARKMKFLMEIVDPRIKAGRDTDGMGCFFDIKVPETGLGRKPEMEYDIDTVTALGARVAARHIDLDIDEASRRKAEDILRSCGIGPGDILVGINPGGMPSRRWAWRSFAALIGILAAKKPCKFVITGSRDEAALGDVIREASGPLAVNLAGQLDVKEMAALIRRCNLFISNDTGPMHIAAALKTPLVAILGPGDITRFDPRNISDRAAVLYKKVPCSPCLKYECDDMKCLKAISPEEVAGAALGLLG